MPTTTTICYCLTNLFTTVVLPELFSSCVWIIGFCDFKKQSLLFMNATVRMRPLEIDPNLYLCVGACEVLWWFSLI